MFKVVVSTAKCVWKIQHNGCVKTQTQHNAHTVDVERFAGLNIFTVSTPLRFSQKYFQVVLGQKCLLFSIIKQRCL